MWGKAPKSDRSARSVLFWSNPCLYACVEYSKSYVSPIALFEDLFFGKMCRNVDILSHRRRRCLVVFPPIPLLPWFSWASEFKSQRWCSSYTRSIFILASKRRRKLFFSYNADGTWPSCRRNNNKSFFLGNSYKKPLLWHYCLDSCKGTHQWNIKISLPPGDSLFGPRIFEPISTRSSLVCHFGRLDKNLPNSVQIVQG